MKAIFSVVMWLLTRYESYALETGKVPTVSWWQRGFPKWVRWVSIGALDVYLFFDWELHHRVADEGWHEIVGRLAGPAYRVASPSRLIYKRLNSMVEEGSLTRNGVTFELREEEEESP